MVEIATQQEHRRIYFTGEVNEESSKTTIVNLLDLEAKDPLKDIIFYINSYGGIADDFIAIHDVIKMLRCRVITVCVGKAMSCSAYLLMSGNKDCRFITSNSRVMLHQLSGVPCGTLSEIENNVEQLKTQNDKIKKIVSEYTKITKKNIDRIFSKDSYFCASFIEFATVPVILPNKSF